MRRKLALERDDLVPYVAFRPNSRSRSATSHGVSLLRRNSAKRFIRADERRSTLSEDSVSVTSEGFYSWISTPSPIS